MADFIPAGDEPRKTWATAFKTGIGTNGAAVDLTPAQITAAQGRCDAIIGRILDKAEERDAWQASVNACDTGNNADVASLRSTIAALKTHRGYTDAIGAALGVISTRSSFDPNTYKAELTSVEQTAPNAVTTKFGKGTGNIEGVHVFSRLQGASDRNFLARDTNSPYVDSKPAGKRRQTRGARVPHSRRD